MAVAPMIVDSAVAASTEAADVAAVVALAVAMLVDLVVRFVAVDWAVLVRTVEKPEAVLQLYDTVEATGHEDAEATSTQR
jgi:hypothetical protein